MTRGPLGLLRGAVPAFVLLDDFAGESPALRDLEALLLRPGAYLATPFPVCQGPDRRATMRRPDQACVLEKTCQLPTKVGGMPGIQVDLVRAAVDAELDCLVGWAASQVVLEAYIDVLHYAPPTRRVLWLALVRNCRRRIWVIPIFRPI
jgi:hypothetical protein